MVWKETGHGSGRMDTVAHFSLPTLDGTWSFRNEWTGNDVYIFLFKYTDSSEIVTMQIGQRILDQ